MAPDWTNQIPNYAICNFFYAFYVVYAVIFVLAVIQILYILSTVKKFDLNNGIMLASGFFTTALALVLTLFHYLVCDRALMHRAIKDVEGFNVAKKTVGKASVCDQGKAKCLEKNKGNPSVCNSC
jgi:uncharacterized membrane protein YcgQ (UPF0703/DUF1980 family)